MSPPARERVAVLSAGSGANGVGAVACKSEVLSAAAATAEWIRVHELTLHVTDEASKQAATKTGWAPVIYLPSAPAVVALVDALPASLAVDSTTGTLRFMSPMSWAAALLPLLVMLVAVVVMAVWG